MRQIIKKYYTKLLTRSVIIIVMIAVILHLDCNIISSHAATEKQASGKFEIPAASPSTKSLSVEKTAAYHFNLGVYYQKQENIRMAIKEY